MKKYLILIAIIFIAPLVVNAAPANPGVTELNVTVSGSTINYNGMAEDGMTSFMCRLLDTSNEEKTKFSGSVEENTFSGSFQNVANGNYKVSCANYLGGDAKVVSVKIGNNSSNSSSTSQNGTSTSSNNPDTHDKGILGSIILLIISTIGIIGASLYLKRKNLKSN